MAISSLCKFAYGIALTTASLGVLSLSTPAYAGSGATGSAIVYGSGSYDSYGAKKHKTHKKQKQHTKRKHKTHKKKHSRATITSLRGHSSLARHSSRTKPAHTSKIAHKPHSPHIAHHSSSLSVHRPAQRPVYRASLPACPSGSRRATDGYCISTNTGPHTSVALASPPHAARTYKTKTHATKTHSTRTQATTSYATRFSSSRSTAVVKPLPVVQPRPVMHQQVQYQQIRVVRPIIYVPYPVPTPVMMPAIRPAVSPCQASNSIRYSRYGNAWPNAGGGCG